MTWFLILAAALWALGAAMRAPARLRWAMIAVLYAGVLLSLAVLPAGNPVQLLFGGTLGEWLLLGALAALAVGYGRGVAALKARAVKPESRRGEVAGTEKDFAEGELPRYIRHVILREIGGPGQKKLKRAKVLVIGAGGLGSPALMYLAAAGVGTIGVIDDDVVDLSNMQRQIAHTDDRVGMPKVFSAQKAMKAVNPHVEARTYHRRLTAEFATELVADYDLVLDGTDNFDTRYLVNAACVAAGKPLISGALTQWEGQVSLFHPARGAPCYRCVFPEAPAPGLAPSCAEAGVAGPLPGVVGSMMAVEAVKEICGAGEGLAGRMLIYDALYAETRVIGVKRRAGCETCGG